MSIRDTCWGFYWKARSIVTPTLKYSQDLWEEELTSPCTPKDVWLDLGCGHHLLSPWRDDQEKALVGTSRNILGLDYDMESLRKHRSITKRVRGDISSLPFSNESFDLVTANMVFEHLSDPERQVAEIHRILKPGGLLMFHTPNSLGYSTLGARLVPDGIKGKIIWFLERRSEEDVFPAYYEINSRTQIERVARNVGFVVKDIRLIVSDAILAVIPPLAAIELLWIRLLMTRAFRPLRTNIIATLEKN